MATQLTGEKKAAILLRAIGEDAAALVMKSLDPKEIRKLGTFMNDTANISKEEEQSVMGTLRKPVRPVMYHFRGKTTSKPFSQRHSVQTKRPVCLNQ